MIQIKFISIVSLSNSCCSGPDMWRAIMFDVACGKYVSIALSDNIKFLTFKINLMLFFTVCEKNCYELWNVADQIHNTKLNHLKTPSSDTFN